jgi:isopenicillin N synthase-like dioxygenase
MMVFDFRIPLITYALGMYETIHIGYEPSMDPGASSTEPNPANFWPEDDLLPGFKSNVGQYYREVMRLSRTLLRLFSLSLDLDESFFEQFAKHPMVMLAMNYYPAAAPQNPDGSGIFAHSDLEGKC